jgi:hypothetical protein
MGIFSDIGEGSQHLEYHYYRRRSYQDSLESTPMSGKKVLSVIIIVPNQTGVTGGRQWAMCILYLLGLSGEGVMVDWYCSGNDHCTKNMDKNV